MSLIVKSISYIHPDRSRLFSKISFTVAQGQKIALVGNNGVGKSTLLKMIAGTLRPSEGEIILSGKPYYIPQHTGQFDYLTIAGALGVEKKLKALQAILRGEANFENLTVLDDDWDIEERCKAAFSLWGISYLKPEQSMNLLSGGEKTKVFLSGISIYSPPLILLDEPSNHLDGESREILYGFIRKSKTTLLAVSHDRTLLDLFDVTLELTADSIETYGGNYSFYKTAKEQKLQALHNRLEAGETLLKKTRQKAREMTEQRQKLEVRGNKQGEKKGLPKIVRGNLQRKAEQSTAHLKDTQNGKMEAVSESIRTIKEQIRKEETLKITLSNPGLHKGKILVKGEGLMFSFGEQTLWKKPLDFMIWSGDRIRIEGRNGTGKTTLAKLLMKTLHPGSGNLFVADFSSIYVDQDYSLLDHSLTVIEQVWKFNKRHLSESDLKMLLHRHQFTSETWTKKCGQLSGGEKMKLLFCCITISDNIPEVILLDEPTNNLDVASQEILTTALKNFGGTLIFISHDAYFVREMNVQKRIVLDE